MNRQQRRAQGIKGPLSSPTVMQTEIKTQAKLMAVDYIKEYRNSIINQATQSVVAAFIVTLHKEMGYGRKRLDKVLTDVGNRLEKLAVGEITRDSLLKDCEELNIDVTVKTAK